MTKKLLNNLENILEETVHQSVVHLEIDIGKRIKYRSDFCNFRFFFVNVTDIQGGLLSSGMFYRVPKHWY